MVAAAVQPDSDDLPVWVVADRLGDLASIFDSLRLPVARVDAIAHLPREATTVLVLADTYPAPRRLSLTDMAHLRSLTSNGARVYLEFAAPERDGSCFGVPVGTTISRPLYERLVLRAAMGGLQPEDLLEEHDGASLALGPLPPASQVLLEYDRCLGTYRRQPWPEPGVFTVTVDLGERYPVAECSQRYGAGQPSYRPESVELWLSDDGQQYRRVGRSSEVGATVRFQLVGEEARYVRLVARKLRRNAVTDFLFMGELDVRDTSGRNLALGRPYQLASIHPQAGGGYADDGRKLTDGVVEGLYTDHLSVGWSTPLPRPATPAAALVAVPVGRGEVLLSAAKLSGFRRRNFRLTERWEELWRQIVLRLLPPERRRAVAARYVALRAHTEPPAWVAPGTPVRLVVRAPAAARVTARRAGGEAIALVPVGDGQWEAGLQPATGLHRYRVTAQTATGRARAVVALQVSPRSRRYRQALDRNMGWFLRSGVLPRADGSAGVHSQICLAWLDSQPLDYDWLGSPFRTDCNTMTLEAFYLYGLVSGDPRYRQMARRIADTVMAHQFQDAHRASLGAFPWLYEGCDVIYFWDDNCRVSTALTWLYHWTGEQRYLRSAALAAELFRQVARDDGCVHRHAIARADLDRVGREAYRAYAQGVDVDFRLMHWWTLAAATGDPIYRALAETVGDVWGAEASWQGLPYLAWYTGDAGARQRLHDLAAAYLRNPAVQRCGAPTVGGGGYELAYEGDCGIATADGEPLTDQLYSTSWLFLWMLRAWRATGEEACRRAGETLGDYLVRIQMVSPDRRLDGCWLRGFDVEHGEYYGAPYDPAYGPYSAYTGWMSAIIAQALAWYLLAEDPFVPPAEAPQAASLLGELRALNPKLISDGPNLALGCPYRLSRPPNPAYGDNDGKLTDGVIDGGYADHRSLGWSLGAVGERLTVSMELDLGQAQPVRLITQQYGAGRGTYNPDEVQVLASADGQQFVELGSQRFGTQGAGLLWLPVPHADRVRYLRFQLSKQRRDDVTDFLFIGETKAF